MGITFEFVILPTHFFIPISLASLFPISIIGSYGTSLGISIYDSAYVALGDKVYTADEKLLKKVRELLHIRDFKIPVNSSSSS